MSEYVGVVVDIITKQAGPRMQITSTRIMTSDFLLYGANGYTGRLILERALGIGLRPLLAGRNAAEVGELAGGHGLEHRAFGLDDTRALDEALSHVSVVLHAAGPFVHTAAPMADA
ncbi:MAG: hypothetical protein ACRELT_17240, partial [Longimicrobiales bacterium]